MILIKICNYILRIINYKMTAKNNIEKVVLDSISPYKGDGTKIVNNKKIKEKQTIHIRSFNTNKIVYFFFFIYIFVGIVLLLR